MRPTVKVWPMPRLTQPQFKELLDDIVEACKQIDILQVHSEDDLITGFPRDDMDYGLGTVLVVDVGVPKSKLLNSFIGEEVACTNIAREVGLTVKKFFVRHDMNPSVQCQGHMIWGVTLR